MQPTTVSRLVQSCSSKGVKMVQDYDDYEEDEGASSALIERALSAVRRRLVLIGLLTAIGTGLATLYALTLQNYYAATAVVQVDPRQKSITNVDTVFADMKGDRASIESEVQLIRSKPLLLKVIKALNLRADPEFGGNGEFRADQSVQNTARPATVEDLLARKADQPGGPQRDYILANLDNQLAVRRVRNTLLIEIKAYSRSPEKAAQIANTLADVYLRDQIQSKKTAAGLASDLLEKKLATLRQELAKAETDVERFKGRHQIFEDGNLRLSRSELARLMEQTVNARNATAAARAKYEQAQSVLNSGRDNGDLADVLQSNTITRMKDELAKARRRRAELATKYGPRHPDMKQSIADVREAQRQLDGEINRLVSNVSNEYNVARAREQQLQADLAKLKSQQSATDEVSVELSELKRRAQNTRQVYEALLARYKTTAETQNLQLPDVRVVERANIALQPSGPNRKRFVILGLIGALGASLLLVLAIEFITPGISRPEDAERVLDVAHLSSMPAIDDRSGRGFNPTHALRMIIAEPHSAYSEAIRNIRRELDVTVASGPSRVIAVTSSLPEEGTETLASNIAHHYALTNNRVLLIDGDLRRGSLTRRLAAQRNSGLLEVLWHETSPDHAILKDQSTGLCFMPAMGPSPLEPASPELLASPHMARVLAHFKSQFDTIIIDTPPLLPVIDGRILADYADKIIFSITWRKTPKQLAKRALRLLGPNHVKVAGVVVNQISPDAFEDSLGFATHHNADESRQRKIAA